MNQTKTLTFKHVDEISIFLFNSGNSYLFWAKSLAKDNRTMASLYLVKAKDQFDKCRERMDNLYK